METILQLAGFEQLEEVGRGGFGIVYRAWQPAFGRHVAIKILNTVGLDPDARSKVDREALAMGTVTGHPNIVTILSSGVTASGSPYFVMPFLAGGSLGDCLSRSGPVTWRRATSTGVAIAGALHTAHLAGVLHRDVKPDNILISEFGEPQLADFGIARVAGSTQTASGQVNATIVYAPPEVLGGQSPTAAGDVYSLAATIYAGAVGRPPFTAQDGESLASVIAQIATQEPRRPDVEIPDAVWSVVRWGLEKDPGDRPATTAEFGGALQRAERQAGTRMTPMTIPGKAAELGQAMGRGADATDRVAPTQALASLNTVFIPRRSDPPTPRARRRRRRRALAGVVVATAMVGAGVVAAFALPGDPSEDAGADPVATDTVVTSTTAPATTTTEAPPPPTAAPTTTVPRNPTTLPDDGRPVVTSLGNLRPGDCYSSEFYGQLVGVSYEAERIPCGLEHDAEVAGIIDPNLSDTSYPGLDPLGAIADERCPVLFEQYVGAPIGVEFVSLTYEIPNETEWTSGPWEEIFCVLVGTEGSPLVGSKRDLRG